MSRTDRGRQARHTGGVGAAPALPRLLGLLAALALCAPACNSKEADVPPDGPATEQPGPELSPGEEAYAQACQDGGGHYGMFTHGCGDTCMYARTPGTPCTMAAIRACDCGPERCWNGTSCEPN